MATINVPSQLVNNIVNKIKHTLNPVVTSYGYTESPEDDLIPTINTILRYMKTNNLNALKPNELLSTAPWYFNANNYLEVAKVIEDEIAMYRKNNNDY